jgi:hypothetical protein
MDQAKVPIFTYVDYSRNSAVLNAIDTQHFFKSYWKFRPRSTGSIALDTEKFHEHLEISTATMIRGSPFCQTEAKPSGDVLGCPPADYLSEVKLSEERVPVKKSLQGGEPSFLLWNTNTSRSHQCTVFTTSKACIRRRTGGGELGSLRTYDLILKRYLLALIRKR